MSNMSSNNSFVLLPKTSSIDPSSITSITSTINSVFQDEFEGFKVVKQIARGGFSRVYEGTANGYEPFVVKTHCFKTSSFKELEKNINLIANEIGIMMYLQEFNLSPEVYSYKFLYSEKTNLMISVIIMEKLGMVDHLFTQQEATFEEMSIQVINVLDKMIDVGISHRDLKWNNVGYKNVDGKRVLIPFDFGMSHHIQVGDLEKIEAYRNMDLIKLLYDTTCVYDDLRSEADSDKKIIRIYQDWKKSVDILSFPFTRLNNRELVMDTKVSSRELYGAQITFVPVATIFLMPNHVNTNSNGCEGIRTSSCLVISESSDFDVLPYLSDLNKKYINYLHFTNKPINDMNTCWC
jgi:hypothetical protein